ncbi:MAG: xylulokinase [Proteobacteria bacterium]|nr:xylulokinase [Pseudomonadota bacterium]
MAQQLFIGIDCGTQGSKAVVLDRDTGAILSEAYATHDMIENNLGRREQQTAWWVAACTKILKQVLTKVDAAAIKAIGVSGQQHGMVALTASGEVIRPAKLWCDTETSEQCAAITSRAGGQDAVIKLIGNTVAAGFTASKIAWMQEHEPQHFDRLSTVLLPHDFINFWLTGERRAECGDASGTAYFDVKNRTWSPELIAAIDPSGKLASCLPELIRSDEPVGTLRPELAEEFGLSTEVLVSSGGGDNMMGAIGTGNVVPGVVTTSLGTSGTIYAHSAEPVIDPQGELAAFCSSTGGWLPLVCTMNVTVSTELVKEVIGMNNEELNQRAELAPLGAEGVMLLPFFNGERTPALPTATASITGLNQHNFTKQNLCRAFMEGPTLGLRYGLDVFKRLGVSPAQVRLIGGGAKSPLWRQMVADIFDCPVVRPSNDEAGALGGAIQALWCWLGQQGEAADIVELAGRYVSLDESGAAEPIPANVAAYAEVYESYLTLDQALRPTYLR